MTIVRFPPHLRANIALPQSCSVEADTVAQAILQLEQQFPGIAAYLVHENGSLRQHVNIFLEQSLLQDRKKMSDSLQGVSELIIMQALSGG